MSKLFKRAVVALISVAVPIALPMPASLAASAPDVLYIDSDALPEGQTGLSGTPATFAVTAASTAAERLKIRLDGQALPDRNFGPHGTRARTQFQLTPSAGWHQLALTVIDAHGNIGRSRVYSFGARTATSSRSAAAGAVVGGRFTEADGSPAASLPVAVYPVQMGGASGTVSAIATTTTTPDGTWSATLPPTSSTLNQWAAANDGVLNLQAVAEGIAHDPKTGEPREMVAVSAFATGLRADGKLTAAGRSAASSPVPTAPLLPVRRLNELPRSPEVAPPVDAPTPKTPTLSAEQASHERPAYFGAASVAGATDGTAAARRIGEVDYTSLPVSPAVPAERSAALPDASPAGKDQCTIESALVTKRTSGTTQYTVALESHAAQDAKGSVTYNQTAGTSLTKGLSYDAGKHWSVNGSLYVGNQTGFSSGFTRGPNLAYEWKVPVAYGYYTIYECKMIKGVKTLVYRYNATHAEKVAIPSGGYSGQYGKDVRSYDGYYGYRDAPYKFTVPRDSFFQVDQNVAKTNSAGAAAWGFSVTSTTTKATTRAQRIEAGTTHINHYVFGYEKIGPNMKVFYSY
jgi:hypothetical protein